MLRVLLMTSLFAAAASAQNDADLVARALDPTAWRASAAEVPEAWVEYDSEDALAARVAAYVEPLVDAHFPRLQSRQVRLVRFESEDTYFRTDVSVASGLKDSEHRIYNLYFNPKAFEDPPPPEALEAILAHELVHLRDYSRLSSLGLTTLLARYLGSTAYRESYERQTDAVVLDLGLARGLRAYRVWIYPRLTRKDYVVKRRTYWTPEEIDDWLAALRPLEETPSPISLEGLIGGR